MPENEFTMVRRLESEPEPTEENLRRMEEQRRQVDEERRLAIEAGERLPPLNGELLWLTKD